MIKQLTILAACLVPMIASATLQPSPRVKRLSFAVPSVLDVKMTCEINLMVYPEITMEVLSVDDSNQKQTYKFAITHGRQYPEQEITVSRNGVEVCQYLTEMSISRFDSEYSFKILDMERLGKARCDGVIGEKLTFSPNTNVYLEFRPKFPEISKVCSNDAHNETYKEYMSRPLGKAGPIPEELTFTGLIKSIFK
jgi:hypothetical protein